MRTARVNLHCPVVAAVLLPLLRLPAFVAASSTGSLFFSPQAQAIKASTAQAVANASGLDPAWLLAAAVASEARAAYCVRSNA